MTAAAAAAAGCFPGRYSPSYRTTDPMRRHCVGNPNTNFFGGIDDSLLSRAEALVAVDISKHAPGGPHTLPGIKHDMMYHHHGMSGSTHSPQQPQNTGRAPLHHHPGLTDPMDHLLDPICSSTVMSVSDSLNSGVVHSSVGTLGSHSAQHHASLHGYSHGGMPPMHSVNGMGGGMMPGSTGHHNHHHHHPVNAAHHLQMHDTDTDPRELEAFAERFKQRRIKLGVTQADVGKALANLKLPGVGSLSQSTICRFESLTLSHNNMIALKPVLQTWLEEAEAQARGNKRKDSDALDVLPNGEKKRKRTSIAAAEKRSLEAYFAIQPRPSGEKIAAIADKLDLKKNVVRVWFCNQRQKQKRMKFSAVQH
ncbi:POU4F2 (predicted) [Pycnogonum litorale]